MCIIFTYLYEFNDREIVKLYAYYNYMFVLRIILIFLLPTARQIVDPYENYIVYLYIMIPSGVLEVDNYVYYMYNLSRHLQKNY
jgi:hypothetical protein